MLAFWKQIQDRLHQSEKTFIALVLVIYQGFSGDSGS